MFIKHPHSARLGPLCHLESLQQPIRREGIYPHFTDEELRLQELKALAGGHITGKRESRSESSLSSARKLVLLPLSPSAALPEDRPSPLPSFSRPFFLPAPPRQNLRPGTSAQTCLLMSQKASVCACVEMSQQVVQAEVSRRQCAMLLTEPITVALGKGYLAS